MQKPIIRMFQENNGGSDKVSLRTLKKLRKKLYRLKKEEQITFVYGSGKRKTALQKSAELLEEYIERLKKYIKNFRIDLQITLFYNN